MQTNDSIQFRSADSAAVIWNLIFIAVIAIFFTGATTIILAQNPQPRQLIAGSIIAAASWLGGAYYWREVVNRATTITIKNNLLAIEEHKGKTVTYSKKFSTNTFRSVYCRRRFGGGAHYEVWARLSGERTEFIVNTWSSKDSAERIRHFIATKLNIVEDENYINSLF